MGAVFFHPELYMRKRIVLSALLVGLFTAAGAQTAALDRSGRGLEDVQRLFSVISDKDQIRHLMEQLFAQTKALNREQIKKREPRISEEELSRMDRESDELVRNFPIDEMMNDMIPVYQRHFNKSDIDGLIAFYSSPTGQKFLREMPTVTAESMQACYPRIQSAVDEACSSAHGEKRFAAAEVIVERSEVWWLRSNFYESLCQRGEEPVFRHARPHRHR